MDLNKIFYENLETALKTSKAIVDPKDKCMASANIALAIAMTGAVTEESLTKYINSATSGADKSSSLKPGANKAKKSSSKKTEEKPAEKAKAEVVPEDSETEETEPVDTENVEETDNDEWPEEIPEEYIDDINELKRYVEGWGEDYVYVDCLYEFSEHQFKGKENVRPSNIKGFVAYLQAWEKQCAEEE